MSFEGYVEVAQDGAGVLEIKDNAKGIFTCNVQSCLVEIFLCMKATILVHDSRQLKLSHIEKLVQKYGTVRKVVFVHRKNYDGQHDDRMKRLIKMASAKSEVLVAPSDTFAVACSKEGAVKVLSNELPVGVVQLPEREKRQSVCEVNNCFLEPNAQNLALDIQYVKGEFGAPRAIDMPVADMLALVKAQPNFFFMNLAVLGSAHAAGVLQVPEYLVNLYEKYDAGRFRYQFPTPEERNAEANEYKAYVSTLA